MIFISSGNNPRSGFPGGAIGCLVLGALGLFGAFYALSWLFKLLWWAAPALFVLALIINWRSVANTGRSLLRTLQTDTLRGLFYIVLICIGFPIFSAYLFFQAYLTRRLERAGQRFGTDPADPTGQVGERGDYTDFEELDSRPKRPLRREEEEY
jgi:hypothetical protein